MTGTIKYEDALTSLEVIGRSEDNNAGHLDLFTGLTPSEAIEVIEIIKSQDDHHGDEGISF